MKIVVSSKSLAICLNKLNLETEYVLSVTLKDKILRFNTLKHSVEIYVEPNTSEPTYIRQENRRWDWVKKLVNQVNDQPISVEISESSVNLIFQY
jgi:hypothetical protein